MKFPSERSIILLLRIADLISVPSFMSRKGQIIILFCFQLRQADSIPQEVRLVLLSSLFLQPVTRNIRIRQNNRFSNFIFNGFSAYQVPPESRFSGPLAFASFLQDYLQKDHNLFRQHRISTVQLLNHWHKTLRYAQ